MKEIKGRAKEERKGKTILGTRQEKEINGGKTKGKLCDLRREEQRRME